MDREQQMIKIHRAELREFSVNPIMELEMSDARTAKDLKTNKPHIRINRHCQNQGISQVSGRDDAISENLFHTLTIEKDSFTSPLLIGIPSFKEGLFFIIGIWDIRKYMLEQLQQYGITQSAGRKGGCGDNVDLDSIFHMLKTELVYQTRAKEKSNASAYGKNYFVAGRLRNAFKTDFTLCQEKC